MLDCPYATTNACPDLPLAPQISVPDCGGVCGCPLHRPGGHHHTGRCKGRTGVWGCQYRNGATNSDQRTKPTKGRGCGQRWHGMMHEGVGARGCEQRPSGRQSPVAVAATSLASSPSTLHIRAQGWGGVITLPTFGVMNGVFSNAQTTYDTTDIIDCGGPKPWDIVAQGEQWTRGAVTGWCRGMMAAFRCHACTCLHRSHAAPHMHRHSAARQSCKSPPPLLQAWTSSTRTASPSCCCRARPRPTATPPTPASTMEG